MRTHCLAAAGWLLVGACTLPPFPGSEAKDSNDRPSDDGASDAGVPGGSSSLASGGSSSTGGGSSSSVAVDGGVEEGPLDAGVTVPNAGWIGGACSGSLDCEYGGGFCLTEAQGFPGGACTLDCTRFCPDQDGPNAVTFCVGPPAGVTAMDGLCVSRCDYGLYPGTGCRVGYGCREEPRHMEASTLRYVCLPGEPSPVSTCQDELRMAGIPFEPTTVADANPEGAPGLTCHIEDPVRITGPMRGVTWQYTLSSAPSPMLVSCALALAMDRMSAEVASRGGSLVEHYGTYNCRVIAGTMSLSQHANGAAVDIAAVRFPDGRRWTVNDDFEVGTMPTTPAGQWLWDLVNALFDARVFNIILTPNYNAAHRNHFHMDLTSGAHTLRALPPGTRLRDQDDAPVRYLGPSLWDDGD